MDIDYIKQLTTVKAPVSQLNLISITQIKTRLQELEENLKKIHGNSKVLEGWEIEDFIKLKMAYLCLLAKAVELNDGALDSPDSQTDKSNLTKKAREILELANKEFLATEKLKEENKLEYNEYMDLGFESIATAEEVSNRYFGNLCGLEEELDRMIQDKNFDLAELKKLQIIYLKMRQAYRKLTDPEQKKMVDENLQLNFNPNRSDLYKSPENWIDEIAYASEEYLIARKGSSRKPRECITNNASGDQIKIIERGRIGIIRKNNRTGKEFYSDDISLKEYTIQKKYADSEVARKRKEKAEDPESGIRWNDKDDCEEFIVCGNINYGLLANPQYLACVSNLLLSNINLQESIKYNGGYIGEVGISPENGEYTVFHDPERLTVAVELQKAEKRGLKPANIGRIKVKEVEAPDFPGQGGEGK